MRSIFHGAGGAIEFLKPVDAERVERFWQHLVSLRVYLVNNLSGLTNYAYAHRHGLRISSAPAESGMSHP